MNTTSLDVLDSDELEAWAVKVEQESQAMTDLLMAGSALLNHCAYPSMKGRAWVKRYSELVAIRDAKQAAERARQEEDVAAWVREMKEKAWRQQ